MARRNKREQSNNLYSENIECLSSVTNEERSFFWDWCKKRYLEDVYIIHALVLWVRSKRKISVSFLLRDCNKELYMKLCIHLSLKWNGYDEIHKCDFLKDLKCTYPKLTPVEHCTMEFDLLNSLGWELE